MREVLFRGFHPNNNGKTIITFKGEKIKGEWVFGLPAYGGNNEISYISDIYTDDVVGIISETLGEYTGTTDKNGEQIFEGDIVEPRYDKWEKCFSGSICFVDGKFGVEWVDFGGVKPDDLRALNDWVSKRIEVVGNIYGGYRSMTNCSDRELTELFYGKCYWKTEGLQTIEVKTTLQDLVNKTRCGVQINNGNKNS